MKPVTHSRTSAFSLTLNLLSEEDKKHIKLDLMLYVIRDVVLLLLFTISIVAILFVVSAKTLDANYREIVQAASLAESQQPAFRQLVLDISEKSESLFKIGFTWEPITMYVSEVARSIQPPSTLFALTVNRDQRAITLVGHAETREHVLEIAKQLEALPFAASVESPLSNILQPTNIQFQFTIRMKETM